MGKLHYVINMSLDGYIEDAGGNFDWSQPTPEFHRFIGELIRPAPLYIYGRRMYESMAVWDNDEQVSGMPDYMQEFAEIWQAADKVVYSRTLQQPSTRKTRIESAFDADAIRQMKDEVGGDILIGGPGIAAHAIEAGLVDEYTFFVVPVAVGSGKPALPLNQRLDLELIESRIFEPGTNYLHYRTR